MPHKALKCLVDVKIHAVSCPGVWLEGRDEVFLSLSLFGLQYITRHLGPTFPIFVFENFKFEKLFPTCFDPAEVSSVLEGDGVYIKLLQKNLSEQGDTILATYWNNARKFLFPHPTFRPAYGDSERELLMDKTRYFPGIISPKLEFSTSTIIKESRKFPYSDRKYFSHSTGNLTKDCSGLHERLVEKKHLHKKEHIPITHRKQSPFIADKINDITQPKYSSSFTDLNFREMSMPPEHHRLLLNTHLLERNCTICHLYQKYFRRPYLGHHHSFLQSDIVQQHVISSTSASSEQSSSSVERSPTDLSTNIFESNQNISSSTCYRHYFNHELQNDLRRLCNNTPSSWLKYP